MSTKQLTQQEFYKMAHRDLFRALWVAQYCGVSAKVVKGWVSGLIAAYKN